MRRVNAGGYAVYPKDQRTANVDYEAMVVFLFDLPHYGGLSSFIVDELRYFAQRNVKVAIEYSPTRGLVPLPKVVGSESNENIVFFPYEPKKPKALLNLRLEVSLFHLLRTFLCVPFLRKVTRRKNLQFIHAHNYYSALSCILAGRVQKTALHIHSVAHEDKFLFDRPFATLPTIKWKIQHLLGFIFEYILEIVVYNLSRIIFCATEKEMRHAYRRCINKHKIKIMYNGIDVSVFKPKPSVRQELRKKLGIPEKSLVCMYLGRMVRSQGPRIIAEAIPLVNSKTSRIFFIFVGEGEEKKGITKYVRENDISNVLFFDGMPAKDILPVADIFVSHVSSLIQSHGRTILEAMASGIPTITGLDDDKAKLFKADEIVFVSKDSPEEIAQAIISLQANDSRRKRLAEKGRTRICKDFSIPSSMSRLERLLRSLS